MAPWDPVGLLLVAVGALAIVGLLLRRLHATRPRQDEIPPDLPSMVVGPGARQILDRASRLSRAELAQLERGHRRLGRYWSGGPEERLLEIAGGLWELLQPTGWASRSTPLLAGAELRAVQIVGRARERALLARAATAIDHAAATAGRQVSLGLAHAVADAAIVADAGDRLGADDRLLLAWPWRDAVEHRSTIPDPGSVVPARLTAVVGVVAAVLAIAAVVGGAPPASALAVYALLGGFVVLAASLFRAMVWRPILRIPAGSVDAGGDRGDLTPPGTAAGSAAPVGVVAGSPVAPRPVGLDQPASAPGHRRLLLGGARPATTDLPSLLLGAMVVVAPVVLIVLRSTPEQEPDAGQTLLLSALSAACPAFVAGLVGARSARGAGRAFAWVIAGVAGVLVVVLATAAVTVDPAGEMWPWLAIGAPLLLGPPLLMGYGAGVLLARVARRLRA